jgi:hypothetical protein
MYKPTNDITCAAMVCGAADIMMLQYNAIDVRTRSYEKMKKTLL